MIRIKTPEQIARMRRSNRLARRILLTLGEHVAPGVSTKELDLLARKLVTEAGGRPSFLGYRGFPAAICASVNEVVVHGIPNDQKLREGDILSVDFGAFLDGFHGDTAATFPVGKINSQAQHLLKVTYSALWRGIEAAVVGNRIGDISHAIQSYVESQGCGVVRKLVGHGVGREMHEDPQVPNFGRPRTGPRLRPGMTLAIEPMITAGSYRVKVLPDGWTVVTADGSLAAHFEHTVVVLSDGPEVLSLPDWFPRWLE
ncbi:MAG TPA: type I methionyl aminopeptidase [Armatimonadetes bacterium]|nr:type I methionyl aminopeptidase [Armatimonadota bacterium]